MGAIRDIKFTLRLFVKYPGSGLLGNEYDTIKSQTYFLFERGTLFITAVGLCGPISFTALLQRHEFGIRSVLGANSKQVIYLVFRRAALLLSVGLLLGTTIVMMINDTLKNYLGVIDFPALNSIRIQPSEALRVDWMFLPVKGDR